MRQDDIREFREFLVGALAFWGQSVSEFTLSVWWEAMLPYDLPAVRKAMSRHAMNPDSGQFAPKPADVVKMLGGTTQDAALVAWAKVDRAVRRVGTYASVCFDDPIINAVLMDMGGWEPLGNKSEDEWPFIAKEFQTRYRGARMVGIQSYPSHLAGISERQNGALGFKSDEVRLIGNQEQAGKVLAGGSDAPALPVHIAGLISQQAA